MGRILSHRRGRVELITHKRRKENDVFSFITIPCIQNNFNGNRIQSCRSATEATKVFFVFRAETIGQYSKHYKPMGRKHYIDREYD